MLLIRQQHHLGTPIEAYNQEGELIWEREQDR